ncbi:MAG: ABC transporter substrate-binding protein [Ilumatobacteraceae bacterium]
MFHPSPRRRRRALGVVIVAASVLAACGGDDDDASGSSAGTSPPAAGATSDATATATADTTAAEDTEAPADTPATAATDNADTTAPGDDDAGEPVAGGTLQIAVGNDALSLNPQGGGSGNDTWYVTRQLYDSLVEQDPETGELTPWLAESWEVNDDATEFTFHLRDDVTFSDGTPFTADSVKANFDDIIANGAKANAALPSLTGYVGSTVVDPQTVTVTFSAPNAPFLQATSTVPLGFVAASTLALPFEERATSGLVGTGPFTLNSYTKDSEVVLDKRAGYAWAPEARANDGEAYLDQIVFTIIPESSVRTGALQSGQVAVIGGVPPQDIQSLRDAELGIVSRANPGLVFGLSAVMSKPLVQDPAVRQAIALAITPEEVRDAALSEDFAVATSPLSSTTPSWIDLSESLTHDAEEAGAVLDGAGWTLGSDGVREKDGQQLDLVLGWISNFGPNQTALEFIQAQLAAAGIAVTLQTGTAPEYLEGLKSGAYDLAWGNLSRADGDVLRTQYSAATTFYGVDDPELEALFTAELATTDAAERDEIFADVQTRLVEENIEIPVFELTTILAHDDTVHDLSLGADSRLHQLTDTWVSE